VKPKGTADKNNEHEVIKQKTELDKNAKNQRKDRGWKKYCV
jgi:hypothetical protein